LQWNDKEGGVGFARQSFERRRGSGLVDWWIGGLVIGYWLLVKWLLGKLESRMLKSFKIIKEK
jgi:hypothetical protein